MNKNAKTAVITLLVVAVIGLTLYYRDPILTALTPIAEFSARLVTGDLW